MDLFTIGIEIKHLHVLVGYLKAIDEKLESIDDKLERVLVSIGKPSARINFGTITEQGVPSTTVPQTQQPKGRVRMKATQKTGPLTLEGLKDRLGNPAQLFGETTWESSDPNVVEIEDGPDGKYAVAKGIGEVVITANGDASSDDGVQPFQATGGLAVTSGDVVEGTINFGSAVEQ